MIIPDYDDEYLIFGMLFILGNRLQAVGDKFYEEITAKQWLVLAMLNAFGDNHPTMNELSEVIGSSHQNVKQIALKLEQKGYVELYSDKNDKRKCRIRMSTKCDEINQKYQIRQDEFIKTLFNDIGPEALKETLKVLIKLEENMEKMG